MEKRWWGERQRPARSPASRQNAAAMTPGLGSFYRPTGQAARAAISPRLWLPSSQFSSTARGGNLARSQQTSPRGRGERGGHHACARATCCGHVSGPRFGPRPATAHASTSSGREMANGGRQRRAGWTKLRPRPGPTLTPARASQNRGRLARPLDAVLARRGGRCGGGVKGDARPTAGVADETWRRQRQPAL